MSRNDAVDRIRQVAVVLTSVDATTARKLLSQLPDSQARLVRKQMANLGSVSPAEREAAMEAFVRLQRHTNASSPSTKPAPVSPAASPAEAILSKVSDSIDRFEAAVEPSTSTVDSVHGQRLGAAEDGFVPVQAHGNPPFSPPWNSTWQNWTGEDLARMLLNERPNIIAALVLQCPTELATGIVQALPSTLASSVLAALPQLHTSDQYVLQEIYDQLHLKLIDFQRQTSPANAGMAKLQTLMAKLPVDQKNRIGQTLARTEPMLAHSLGLEFTETASAIDDVNRASVSVSAAAVPEVPPTLDEASEAVDMIVPFVAQKEPESQTEVDDIGEPAFEELIQFSPQDLAIVLRSVDPQTILLATSAAGAAMRARVESLIDSKDVDRLRKRLHGLRRASIVEKTAAQQKIAHAAGRLLQQGRIAGLSSVTFVAA